jgi:hypothetical protein
VQSSAIHTKSGSITTARFFRTQSGPRFQVGRRSGLQEVIAILNAAAVDAWADPVVRGRLAGLWQDNPPRAQQTPAALGARQKSEIEKGWPIIKAAGIKGE